MRSAITEAVARDLAAQTSPSQVLASGRADPASYERARRIWNGAVQNRPALILQARNVEDVRAGVRVARRYDMPLSVRGGGHDWAGRSLRDGGLVIDLSAMRHVEVDVQAQIASVAGGATAGDVIAAASPYGLVAATGTVSAVGMAGLTLGGGYGPLNGRFGLALDNLLGADIVLADGRLVTADPEHEPELYWALRGAGGNFGVVTAMRIRLHPVPRLLAGSIMFPWTQAAAVLLRLGEYLRDVPDELTVQSGVVAGPDGSPTLFMSPTWSGDDLEDGQKRIDELLGLGTPVMSQVGPMTYGEMLELKDSYVVNGRHHAARTRSVITFTPDVASAIVAAGAALPTPYSGIFIHHFHGVAGRVPRVLTAFAQQGDHFMIEFVAAWDPDDPGGARHRQWTDTASAALAPHALPGGYANMLGPDDHEQIPHIYGPNTARLRAAKRRFDPEGIFSATPLSFDEE